MEAQMNLTQNPLQSKAEAVAVVVPHVISEAEVLKDPELKKAKAIIDELQLNIFGGQYE